MDLAFFFRGTQSKEETSSAILATLLQHDVTFRTEFLRDIRCAPALESELDWTVRVEDSRAGMRRLDLTLEAQETVVLIENKLSQSAKREGQLVEYYDASAAQWPDRRVIALYLTPEQSWGRDEVESATTAIRDAGRSPNDGPDWAQAISWARIREIIGGQAGSRSWFARSGIEQIDLAINAARSRVNRSWTVPEFVDAAAERSPQARFVVEGALEWLKGREIAPDFGRGATGPMYLTLPTMNGPAVRVVKVYVPEGSINISYRRLAKAAPFDEVSSRVELIHCLNQIPGTAPIRDEYATNSESSYISNEVLANPVALHAFLSVIDWIADAPSKTQAEVV